MQFPKGAIGTLIIDCNYWAFVFSSNQVQSQKDWAMATTAPARGLFLERVLYDPEGNGNNPTKPATPPI